MSVVRPRRFSGTRDFLPREMIPREEMTAAVKAVFARFGYDPVETPAIEYLSVLKGKYGEDAEKLIYTLDYKRGTPDAAGLRYDLTVPLARLVASVGDDVPLPFRRYQIQPVWRAERAQVRQGRYREFVQCDADCVGAASMAADAEIIAMVRAALAELGLPNAVVLVNHRRILSALMEYLGVSPSDEPRLLRCVDKRDKVGADGVRAELLKTGFSPDLADSALDLFTRAAGDSDPLAFVEHTLSSRGLDATGVAELREVLAHLDDMGVTQGVRFDPWMVRGLDYYTGPVFEAVLPDLPHMGSLAGGGRYDGLIGLFLGRDVPAVGVTVGLDRIFTALEQLGRISGRSTRAKALVAVFDAERFPHAQRTAAALRDAGVPVALYPAPDRLKKQFRYASRLGVRYVVLVGPDEAEKGLVAVKDLTTGDQQTMPLEDATRLLEKAD